MKIVIQRVSRAEVSVDNKIVGSIKRGYLILVGIGSEDDAKKAVYLASKTAKLRIMADEKGKMNLSLNQAGGEALVISQFTLYADSSGGNRPSFINAAEPKKAETLYRLYIETLIKEDIKVATGKFGEYMRIKADLDGPVTIILEE